MKYLIITEFWDSYVSSTYGKEEVYAIKEGIISLYRLSDGAELLSDETWKDTSEWK